jgi:hypothetical protein
MALLPVMSLSRAARCLSLLAEAAKEALCVWQVVLGLARRGATLL